jgi:prophage DNA circulation protein
MSWRDDLLPGTFRGVPFVVESSDGNLGRRVAVHEYPQRDNPYAEDLGRKGRRFTLDLYIHGAEYMAGRDRMIAALEQSGSGALVHPYLGEMTVSVLDARGPRESTREGGMARFSVDFIESGEAVFPAAATDGAAVLDAAADDAAAAIVADFTGSFDVTGPAWVGDHAVTLVGKITDGIDAVKNTIPELPTEVIRFSKDLQSLSASVESLIRAPADLAAEVYGLITDLALLPDRPERALDAYRQLFDLLGGETAIDPATPNRTRQRANQSALTDLVQRASVVEAVRSAGLVEFDNVDQAVLVRDELAEELDDLAAEAADPVFAALTDLRAGLVGYVADSVGDLARLVSYIPADTLPALVIAHILYGDATREADLVARNDFRHPGFVQGGEVIEVRTDV